MEFKETDVLPECLAQEMFAFANSLGFVLAGVSDAGEIKGLRKSELFCNWEANILRKSINLHFNSDNQVEICKVKSVGVIAASKGLDNLSNQ